MTTRAHIGRNKIGSHLFGGKVATSPVTPSGPAVFSDHYMLQLTDADFNLLAYLPNYVDCNVTERINAPSSMTLVYPNTTEDQATTALMVYPNMITVRRRDSTPLQRYKIRQRAEGITEDGQDVITLSAESWLHVLQIDDVEDYDTGSSGARVDVVVRALLNFQGSSSRRVYLAHMSMAIATKNIVYSADGIKIYDALEEVRRMVGGFYVTNSQGAISWNASMTFLHSGQQIRYNKNMGSLNKETTWDRLATKVIAKGKYGGEATVSDATAIATYGTVTRTVQFPNVAKVSELAALAENVLNQYKAPQVNYTIGALDLEKSTSRRDWSNEELYVGFKIRIVWPEKSIDVTRDIIRITRSLSNPVAVTIELKDPVDYDNTVSPGETTPELDRNIIQELAEAIRKIKDLQQRVVEQDPPRVYRDPSQDTAETDIATLLADFATNVLGSDGHPETAWEDGESIVVDVPSSDPLPDPKTFIRDEGDWVETTSRPYSYEITSTDTADADDILGTTQHPENAFKNGEILVTGADSDERQFWVRTGEPDSGAWEELGGGDAVTISTDIPEKHSAAGAAGSSTTEVSAKDHSHPGRPYYEATTKALLPNTSIEANAEGEATTTKRRYRRNSANDDWISYTHLES